MRLSPPGVRSVFYQSAKKMFFICSGYIDCRREYEPFADRTRGKYSQLKCIVVPLSNNNRMISGREPDEPLLSLTRSCRDVFRIKKINNIAREGLDLLGKQFSVSAEEADPRGFWSEVPG